MITQIKRWFQKLFAWFSWQNEPVTTYAPMENHLNRGIGSEPMPRTLFDETISQPGVAPQFGNQGDPRCSTIEEWHEPGATNMPHPQSVDDNRAQEAQLPPPPPLLESSRENMPAQGEQALPTIPPAPAPAQATAPSMTPPPSPTAEQQLEFLRYLVRRGLVNEGFTEGQMPDQYRKN
jgi:hypothetical protein